MDNHHYLACSHLKKLKQHKQFSQEFFENYEFLHACYVACLYDTSLNLKKEVTKCRSCNIEYNGILVCLECKAYGCKLHIQAYCDTPNHVLAMNICYGYVFCLKCDDYQYDFELEEIAKHTFSKPSCPKGVSVNYKWVPKAEEANILKQNEIINVADIGLKGIVNMGNTCYISVILQTLVHAPLFRDYFLSLQHKCKCEQLPFVRKIEKREKVLIEKPPYCFICEISNFIQEYFSDGKEPLVLDKILLLLLIRESDRFPVYSQQDASDFYTVLVKHLHCDSRGERNFKNFNFDNLTHECSSIFDSIFNGFLHWKYTCSACNNVMLYTTRSFDREQLIFCSDGANVSFEDSLKKNLNQNKEGRCKKCKAVCQMHGQIISKKLPAVLSFQMHYHSSNTSQKSSNSETSIAFPEFLDLTPYLSGTPCHPFGGDPSNLFFLFAVAVYKGDGAAGHYYCYVRRNRRDWYKCDDVTVTLATNGQIFEKNPYLLFYHRPIFENDMKNFSLETI